MLSFSKKSRPPVDPLKLRFLYEKSLGGREGRLGSRPLFHPLSIDISYLYLYIYIYFNSKKNIGGRLFQRSLSEFLKKVPKKQKHSHSLKKSTSCHFLNLSCWLLDVEGGRLGSRPSVDLLDLQSFFENVFWRLKWS